MKNTLQTTAITFTILVTTFCHAQQNQNVTVDFSVVSRDRTVVSVYILLDGTKRGEDIACNVDAQSCYMPSAGDKGVMQVGGPQTYRGPNVTIYWRGIDRYATYAVESTK
jgi:hypothetical protein